MTIALRAAQGSNNGAGSTILTLAVPAGVVNGDVMVAVVTGSVPSGPISFLWPPGWTLLGSGKAATTIATTLAWKVASGEPASYNITITPSHKACGVVVALSGADVSIPTVAQYGMQSSLNTAATFAPAIGSWAASDGMSIFFGTAVRGPVSFTAPTGGYVQPSGGFATTGVGAADISSNVALVALTQVANVSALNEGLPLTANAVGAQVFIKATSAIPPQMSYYGGSGVEPAGVNAETGIVLSLSDAQAPAVGVSPITVPATTGTNFSWIMLLALKIISPSAVFVSNRRIAFASAPASGSAIFFANQPTYRDPSLNNKPADSVVAGATPAVTGAGAPASYTAITTTPQLWDNTSHVSGVGRNGNFVELIGAVDNTYLGGPGQETFPNLVITCDGA